MKTSESIATLAEALAKAQAIWPTVGKDAKGYGYQYAPLDRVLAALREGLAKNGLSFVQFPGQSEHIDQVVLTTRLMHSSGEWLEDTMTMPIPQVGKANVSQTYGAALTYARRYSIEAVLGIASSEDTDGAVQEQNAKQPKKQPVKKKAEHGPLPDDEQVIYEASATDFMVKVIALINRYDNAEHVKAVFKQLGYTGAPKGNSVLSKKKRVEMYRALKEQAAVRDAEEAVRDAEEANQTDLFEEEVLNGAYAE